MALNPRPLLPKKPERRGDYKVFALREQILRSISVRIGCAIVLGVWAVGAQAQKINLPPVTRTTLPNGARVVLMEYHRAPSIVLTAQFAGGSIYDPAEKTGVADLTTTLMRKGTETRTALQLAEQIDTLGGSLSAGAGDDRVSVTLDVLSKDTDAGMNLFADVIRHPTLPEDELTRERQLEISSLQALGESPGAIASRVANEIVYAGHPYGRESTITSLKNITREDLRAFYDQIFRPNRMILVAVGDFKSSDMLAKLTARFGDWKADAPALPTVAPFTSSPRKVVLVDKPDATQTQVRWIRAGFPRRSPDFFAAQLAQSALGGGFTSRLINEIRVNRSLTYGISSFFAPQLLGGDFEVSTFTKIETTKALLDATTAVLQQAADKGLTAAEIQKAKSYLSGQFAIEAQSPESLAGQLANIAFYGLPADYLQTYLLRLRAVPLADVNRVARAYFGPQSMSLILVAPAAKVKSQLSNLGNVDIRPVDTIGK